jgi:hypothetical protein
MSRLERLQYLAEAVSDSLNCNAPRDDGGDWEIGDKGFDEHVEGCLHCMALDALGPDDEAKP